jgi:uncharacterized protein YqfA (UPF0365 family)
MIFVVIGIAAGAGGSLGLGRVLGASLRRGNPAAKINPMVKHRQD